MDLEDEGITEIEGVELSASAPEVADMLAAHGFFAERELPSFGVSPPAKGPGMPSFPSMPSMAVSISASLPPKPSVPPMPSFHVSSASMPAARAPSSTSLPIISVPAPLPLATDPPPRPAPRASGGPMTRPQSFSRLELVSVPRMAAMSGSTVKATAQAGGNSYPALVLVSGPPDPIPLPPAPPKRVLSLVPPPARAPLPPEAREAVPMGVGDVALPLPETPAPQREHAGVALHSGHGVPALELALPPTAHTRRRALSEPRPSAPVAPPRPRTPSPRARSSASHPSRGLSIAPRIARKNVWFSWRSLVAFLAASAVCAVIWLVLTRFAV